LILKISLVEIKVKMSKLPIKQKDSKIELIESNLYSTVTVGTKEK